MARPMIRTESGRFVKLLRDGKALLMDEVDSREGEEVNLWPKGLEERAKASKSLTQEDTKKFYFTPEEYAVYSRKLRASEGFDVGDVPAHVMLEVIRPVRHQSDPIALQQAFAEMAKVALGIYNENQGTRYQFSQVIRVNYVCTGALWYYITFQAKKVMDGSQLKNFQALMSPGRLGSEAKVEFCRVEPKPELPEDTMEGQVEKSNQMVQESEQNMLSAVEQLEKYKMKRDDLQEQASNTITTLSFSLHEIEGATGNFDPSMKIGQGGYGSVYRDTMEGQVEKSNQMVQESEQNMLSAVEQLEKYKMERDDLQEQASNTITPLSFSLHEIEGATGNFDPSMKIGQGGSGSIYRGFLRHTQVAIKTLISQSMQGRSEFQQEVHILSKLRHPNIVTLIGSCPEPPIIIYEYLPNGSLEDRLSCRDNSTPLSWKTRIRIAAELCSVLIFLHSESIVHGDLKPDNILLDANYVCKLSDFGICRVVNRNEESSNTTGCYMTVPKGTFGYIDPEFVETGELTPKSDVYSFGVILLRLLTGNKPVVGLPAEMQRALDGGRLKDILDPTVEDWPFVQAQQLAYLAMRCCKRNRTSRPDLASEVWRLLEPMRASCDISSFQVSSEESRRTSPHFICPILQDIMVDPHVAADGFTYELEALRGWFDGGHKTSPMTNLPLPHCNIVPNHTLRSVIQEWQQLQRR